MKRRLAEYFVSGEPVHLMLDGGHNWVWGVVTALDDETVTVIKDLHRNYSTPEINVVAIAHITSIRSGGVF